MINLSDFNWNLEEPRTGEVEADLSSNREGFCYKTVHINNENGDQLAEVMGYTARFFVHPDKVELHAKLIVSAPKLLHALQDLSIRADYLLGGLVTTKEIENDEFLKNFRDSTEKAKTVIGEAGFYNG